jgi:23S rRNA (guanosine2251-2'-O)-methyltransferase
LRSKKQTIEKIFIYSSYLNSPTPELNAILTMAKQNNVHISSVSKEKLTELVDTDKHQGVVAIVTSLVILGLDELLAMPSKNKYRLYVILDGIEDPHNFGAISRSAEAFGADGIIWSANKGVGITATAYKTSAGSLAYLNLCKVSNINYAIEKLKKNNIWVAGLDASANEDLYTKDWGINTAIVIGSEGFGMQKLVKSNCDFLIKIPMYGETTSLNASVASGIAISHISYRQNTIATPKKDHHLDL